MDRLRPPRGRGCSSAFASRNAASVIWNIPTALDEGRYSSKRFQLGATSSAAARTGLPAPSICASAASSSGAMMAVECSRKSGPYWAPGFQRRLYERAA